MSASARKNKTTPTRTLPLKVPTGPSGGEHTEGNQGFPPKPPFLQTTPIPTFPLKVPSGPSGGEHTEGNQGFPPEPPFLQTTPIPTFPPKGKKGLKAVPSHSGGGLGWGWVLARAIAFAAALAGAAHAATAADYPSRPIRALVPFAPGGGADTLARIVTPKLSESMGQQWVVDNRTGAAGNIAAETVARAAPDGYTVFMGFSTVLTVNPALYKLPFDMERDLQPVTLLATAQYILVLHPAVPAASVKELVALAKQKPGSLNFASAGVGSPLHLAAELFQRRAGIQVKAGRLKALAATALHRSKVAPDLPTMAESGFPGFDVTTWYSFMLPARTSAAINRRLQDEAAKALQRPDVQQVMSAQGLEAETSTREALAARIKAESRTWGEVIKAAGIRAD
jgi:tripartite-type tricarboxylate transporter receptor subunit TctC